MPTSTDLDDRLEEALIDLEEAAASLRVAEVGAQGDRERYRRIVSALGWVKSAMREVEAAQR